MSAVGRPACACHDANGAKRLERKTPRNVAAALVGGGVRPAAGGAALGAAWAFWRLGAGLRPAADGRGRTGLFTRIALARSSSAALSPWVH